MKIISAALMALGLLLLSGCATRAPSPTETPVPAPLAASADDVIGVWQEGDPDGSYSNFLQFGEDGTYRVSSGSLTNLEDGPQELGRFTLEGGLVTFVASDESLFCAGQSGTYEVRLLEQGRLSFSLREDPCSLRAVAGILSFVEPLSP